MPDEEDIYKKYDELAKEVAELKRDAKLANVPIDNMLGPRIPDPKTGWYDKRTIKNQPKKIVVRLTGMSEARSVEFGASHGLNNEYSASTWSENEVTDQNDIAFFIYKAIKNPDFYEILEPANLVEKYIEDERKVAEKEKAEKATEKKKFLDRFKKRK